jgi:uncharacterized protein YndB with AHSA1/START domain
MSDALRVETESDAPELILEREFDHPVEAVFKAWTDQDALRHWMGPTGFTAPDTEFDARAGGAYVVPMVSPDGNIHTARGVIKELVPNKRLAITWAWDQDDGSAGQQMEIALDFLPTKTGTKLVLHQTNFIDEKARDMHGQGWGGSFDCLEAYLGA